MSIKHKWLGWFVFSVLLFCCADLKAVDNQGFATSKDELPTELQKYTEISDGKITFTVKAKQKIDSTELYFQNDFSFTAIRPSSNNCNATVSFGGCSKNNSVKWLDSNTVFRFGEDAIVPTKDENVKVVIEGDDVRLNEDPKKQISCGLHPSGGRGQFQKKVNISIFAKECHEIAFKFDASEFGLLATTTTTPAPPTTEELTSKAISNKKVSELATNESEINSTATIQGAGMNTWVWIGIAVGGLVLVLVIVFVVWCFCFKKKNGSGEQNKKGHNSSLDGVMHGSSRVRPGSEYSQRTYDDTKRDTDEPIESNEPSKENMRKNKKPSSEPIGKLGRLQKKASEPIKKSAPVKKVVEAEQIPGLAAEQVQQQHIRDRDQDNEKPKSDHVYEVLGPF